MTDLEIQEFEGLLKTLSPTALSPQILSDAELSRFAGALSSSSPLSIGKEEMDSYLNLITEAELEQYQPAKLRNELLESCDLIPLEEQLAAKAPNALDDDFLNRLVTSIESSELSEQHEKVIPFPTEKKKTSPFKWYATAAAVALTGLFTGFTTFNTADKSPAFAYGGVGNSFNNIQEFSNTELISNDRLLNVSTNSTVLQTNEEGIIQSKHDGAYYRVMRVVFMGTYEITNDQGQKVKVERPVEKLIYVPVETD